MKKLIIANIIGLFAANAFGEDFILYSGNQSGVYYQLGEQICEVLGCENKSTTGSLDNLSKLENNKNSIAIIQSDIIANHEKKLARLKSLYTESYTIAVKENSNIKTIADLKGKIVNLDRLNSGTYYGIMKILNSYGISLADFSKSQNLPVNQDLKALCQEKIDASFHIIGHPNIGYQAAQCKLKFIHLNDKIAREIVAKDNSLKFTKIKSDAYSFNLHDVETIGVSAVLVAPKSIDPVLLKKIKIKLDKNYNIIKDRFFHQMGIKLE